MANPLNDDDYTSNDDQIADLKELVETLNNCLSDCITQMGQCVSMFPDDMEFLEALENAHKAQL
ncbi:MAG: hypothetical protein V3T82_07985 [Nitrospinaceae bacterium]